MSFQSQFNSLNRIACQQEREIVRVKCHIWPNRTHRL